MGIGLWGPRMASERRPLCVAPPPITHLGSVYQSAGDSPAAAGTSCSCPPAGWPKGEENIRPPMETSCVALGRGGQQDQPPRPPLPPPSNAHLTLARKPGSQRRAANSIWSFMPATMARAAEGSRRWRGGVGPHPPLTLLAGRWACPRVGRAAPSRQQAAESRRWPPPHPALAVLLRGRSRGEAETGSRPRGGRGWNSAGRQEGQTGHLLAPSPSPLPATGSPGRKMQGRDSLAREHTQKRRLTPPGLPLDRGVASTPLQVHGNK